MIESARRHTAAQRAEASRLAAEIPDLNARLGELRLQQEHMQRPSTLLTETARQRAAGWIERVRLRANPRRSRRP